MFILIRPCVVGLSNMTVEIKEIIRYFSHTSSQRIAY